jgi:DNA polymerase-3 subunit delta
MFYVFHGPDEFSRAELIAELQSRMGDPAMVTLNTSYLDGRKVTLGELRHACDTIPFMAERRLVIVEGFLSRLHPRRRRGASEGSEKKKAGPASGRKRELEQLLEYLPTLPETTRLVFVENELLDDKHPVLKLARQAGSGHAKKFVAPDRGALQKWIVGRAASKEGQIESGAARALASYVGGDLRMLDQELEKLLSYVGGTRPVGEDDVHLLTPYVRETNIFDMIDAVREGDGRKALSLLHHLLEEGKAPLYLFSMIVNQFRILIQVKELLGQNKNQQEIVKELKLHPYAAQKAMQQARSFSQEQLRRIYSRLLATDLAIKTGQMSDLLALDMLVVDLCR